jgi:hypothetical protein
MEQPRRIEISGNVRSVAPAVTKRALLTDDGQHVIVRAHT